MKTAIRRLIETEIACGTLVTLADRLEQALINLIREEFAHERRWKGFTTQTLEQRLTEPTEETWSDGPTPGDAA